MFFIHGMQIRILQESKVKFNNILTFFCLRLNKKMKEKKYHIPSKPCMIS